MDESRILQEVQYRAVRSSGAGGQHVNKVASKAELHFEIHKSEALTETEKQRILLKLNNRFTKNGELIFQCQESRSLHKNKEIVHQRFLHLLRKALERRKPRKKTKIPRSAKMKRLRQKKFNAQKKERRKDPLSE